MLGICTRKALSPAQPVLPKQPPKGDAMAAGQLLASNTFLPGCIPITAFDPVHLQTGITASGFAVGSMFAGQ